LFEPGVFDLILLPVLYLSDA